MEIALLLSTDMRHSRHAKSVQLYSGHRPRNQLLQCRPVRIGRPPTDNRFAATLGFALGSLEFSVKIDPALYSQIVRDDRVSHGAFRLWHLLREMTGANPCCWPSAATLAKVLHTNKNSVFAWIIELEASLYLRIERGHRHKSNRYFVGGTKGYHGGTKSTPPGGTKSGYELNPVIQSKNSGQGGSLSGTPLALPESKEKRVRTPDALLKSVIASMRAANGNEP